MRIIKRLPGIGMEKDNERVSAVFTVYDPETDSFRYVLRQACEKGLKAHGHKPNDTYFGFPGSNGYTGETPEQTAVRTAKQWGFDVHPKRHFADEDTEAEVTRHYVFSDCDNDKKLVVPDNLVISYSDPLTEQERRMIFLTARQLVDSDNVLDNAKQIVRFWDYKSL
ncbi:hypothetical protein CL614_00820 [archaeon]|nr:hypothetical protein [archaeon]|tara:strand:+ start:845 stop:1345 length:501 start_codon:yes stop_codon:yes gene_type:complete